MKVKTISITENDRKRMRQYRDDVLYIDKHLDELTEKYPNQWIAVHKKEIVGVDNDFDSLIKKLSSKNIPLGKTAIEYLSTSEDMMVLLGNFR